jgi:signal transduction histidine kinase
MSESQRGSEVGVNLSIVKKGLILAAIPLLTQLLFLGVLFKMRRDQLHAQKLAMHSKEVIAQTEGFFRVVMEGRAAVCSLTLTGGPVFVNAWEKARHEAADQLLALRDLVNDNPSQQKRIDRIIQQTQEALGRLDAIAQMARQPQTRNKAMSALGELWVLSFADELRRELDEFLREEERIDGERQQSLERVREEETWTLIGGAVLALLSTAGLAFVFRQGVASRLAVLMDNVHRIGAGERLPAPMGGRDELGRLDRVFHEMADTLDQKDRENELFVYSVSHDLRSPLVNLQGFSQELALVCQDLRRIVAENGVPSSVRERVDTLLDRNANESIQFIQTAVRRLATIIDSLLRLSRVGRVVYDWQQVDVRAVVERVVTALGNSIVQKGARVTVGDLPPAWGDATAIEQIFANLLGNALNYLDPARPGVIEVGSGQSVGGLGDSTRPTEGAVGWAESSRPTGNSAAIEDSHTYYVKDNGLGIESEQLPKIFLAFQRLHPAVAPGEGIGLSLVRRMVERHGGRIWVESAVGQGSTFFVTLPAHPVNGAMGNGQTSVPGEPNTWQRSRSA